MFFHPRITAEKRAELLVQEKDLVTALQRVRSRLNAAAPISSLPEDILMMVLELAVDDIYSPGFQIFEQITDDYPDNEPDHFPIYELETRKLSHVCSSWYHLMLSHAVLWSRIRSNTPKNLAMEFQTRSREYPLLYYYLDDLMQPYLPPLERIGTLEIVLEHPTSIEDIEEGGCSLPLLQSASISLSQYMKARRDDYPVSTTLQAPSLRSLSLTGICLKAPGFYHSLRFLSITFISTQLDKWIVKCLSSMLPHIPSLESFDLRHFPRSRLLRVEPVDTSMPRSTPLHVHSIQRLCIWTQTLESFKVFRSLVHAPNARHIFRITDKIPPQNELPQISKFHYPISYSNQGHSLTFTGLWRIITLQNGTQWETMSKNLEILGPIDLGISSPPLIPHLTIDTELDGTVLDQRLLEYLKTVRCVVFLTLRNTGAFARAQHVLPPSYLAVLAALDELQTICVEFREEMEVYEKNEIPMEWLVTVLKQRREVARNSNKLERVILCFPNYGMAKILRSSSTQASIRALVSEVGNVIAFYGDPGVEVNPLS